MDKFTLYNDDCLNILKTMEEESKKTASSGTRIAILETGARIEVPPFVEVGDIVKVDTTKDEYIQRV